MARILVVEDDADIAHLLGRRLQSYGHIVRIAPNGPLAIHSVGFDFEIDVVLLDVHLPGQLGFDVLEQLRRHPELDNPNLPAVFLSGSVDQEIEDRAHQMGCSFLRKPFVSGELQGAILKAAGLTPAE